MIELFTAMTIMDNVNPVNSNDDIFKPTVMNTKMPPISWIIMALIISFGTAYIAFACNEYESPATRAISTIIAFFFSGIYLIYYFIVHVLFDRKCGSRGINNIVRNIVKPKNK